MRDLVVFGLFVFFLPMCLLRPWVGICAFSFLAYNRTQDLTWGFARGLPISQAVAIAMISGWLLFESRALVRNDRRVKAMIWLVVVIAISMFSNTVRWDFQGHRLQELGKVMFVAVLTSAFCVDRKRLRQICLVVAFGLGFYGVKNGLMWLIGSNTIAGPGGMLKDNNDFALAMVMNLPFLIYISNDVADMRNGRAIKWGMWGMAACTFLTIGATGSRGAFLATACTVGWMVMKTRYKLPALFAAVLLAIIGWFAAPTEYQERISSMFVSDTRKLDQSAKGRLVSWAVALNMIKANPGLGIGFNNMVHEYHKYTDGVDIPLGYDATMARVAHNSYLQIWAESGTFAYLIFMYILLSTILFMWRNGRRYNKDDDSGWAVHYCRALESSLIAFVVGATFLNRAHFDLVYQLVAVAAAIPAIVVYERARLPQARWGRSAARKATPRPAWSAGRPPAIGTDYR